MGVDHDQEGLSKDAKAIIDAIDSDWIGRGFFFGIGLSAWTLIVGLIAWAVWPMAT